MTRSVFISSTALDLGEHRAAVDAAIRRLEQRPINMQDFGSQPGGAAGVSLREVGKADVFIVVLARRYGYVPAGMDKSVTEQEYDEAVRRGLPRLMYLVDPAHDWDWPGKSEPANQEDADKQAKLAAFKARVEATEVRSRFTTPDNLAQQVTADLTKLLQLQDRANRQFKVTLIGFISLFLIVIGFTGLWQFATQYQNDRITQEIGDALLTSLTQPPATPLDGRICTDDEVCVVIAQFTGERGGDQQINMLEVLNQAAAEVSDVSIIPIDYPLDNRTQAQAVGETYNATLVIYGRVTAGGVTVSYEVTREQSEVWTQVEGDFRTSAAQVENFDVFLYEGMQSRYILSFTVGQLHYVNERYSEALRAFNAALIGLDGDQASDDLNLATLHFYRGNSYQQLEDDATAIADYTEAIYLDPNYVTAYNNRGVALSDQGKLDEAIADYTVAIRLDPESAIAYNNRGAALFDQGDLDEAIADYTVAIRLDPESAIAYNNRGLALSDQGELDEAIADYTTAIRIDPVYARAYYNRGLALLQQGRLDEAIADYTEAIRLDPDDPTAYNRRGNALSKQGKLNEAIADYTEAIRLDPGDAVPYNNRGNVIYESGQLDAAIANYTEAIRLDPDYVTALYNRGIVLLQQGKLDEAIADFTEAIRLDSDYAIAYWGRGSTYYDQREYALAIADYLTYERLTGQLEPFIVTRIAEMEAALGTPTAVATP